MSELVAGTKSEEIGGCSRLSLGLSRWGCFQVPFLLELVALLFLRLLGFLP